MRSVQKRRERRKNVLGVLMIVGVIAVIGLLGIVRFSLQGTRPALDLTTGCPEGGATSLTVLLVDRTDPLAPIQQAALLQHLRSLRQQIERYGALEVYSVGSTAEAPLQAHSVAVDGRSTPHHRFCNPGLVTEPGLTENKRLSERRYKTLFEDPLERIFSEVLERKTEDVSPIMESIQSVAVTAFLDPRLENAEKKLVIVSDLLQHTPGHSQYNGRTPFSAFRELPYYQRLQCDLTGVTVDLLYVRRPVRRTIQGKFHIQFWQRYIASLGGTVVRVKSLSG